MRNGRYAGTMERTQTELSGINLVFLGVTWGMSEQI